MDAVPTEMRPFNESSQSKITLSPVLLVAQALVEQELVVQVQVPE